MKIKHFSLILGSAVLMVAPAFAQDTSKDVSKNTDQNADLVKMSPGQKARIAGVVVNRDADSLLVRDEKGDVRVALSNFTKVEEKKSNPFRGARKYPITTLARGLVIEVEGRG